MEKSNRDRGTRLIVHDVKSLKRELPKRGFKKKPNKIQHFSYNIRSGGPTKGYFQISTFPGLKQKETLNTNYIRNIIKLGLQLSANFFVFHLLFSFYFFTHYRNLLVINSVLTQKKVNLEESFKICAWGLQLLFSEIQLQMEVPCLLHTFQSGF